MRRSQKQMTVCALCAAVVLLADTFDSAAAEPVPTDDIETRRQAARPPAPEEFPVRIAFAGDVPAPLSLADFDRAATEAAKTWNEVTCSIARVEYVGHRASREDLDPDETGIAFATVEDEPVLAREDQTGEVFYFPGVTISGCEGDCRGLGEPAVLLNESEFDWDTEPHPRVVEGERQTLDLQAVLTHEFGHVLGLGHLGENPGDVPQDRLATMRVGYINDGGQRTLAAYDKFVLCTLHPGGDPECEGDDDCDPSGSCATHEGLSVCQEERGEIGAECAFDHLICPDRCFVTSETTGDGYCTTRCTTDDECPDDFLCEPTRSGSEVCQLPFAEPPDEGCSVAGRIPPPSGTVLWSLLALLGCLFRRKRPRLPQLTAPLGLIYPQPTRPTRKR